MAGGGAGGMGQPIGNASALPQGNPFGGGMGGGMGGGFGGADPYNSGAPRQSTTQSNPGSAMGTMFGMLGQQPTQNPFGGQQLGQLPPPNQTAQPMPQQPQQPAYQSNPDFQAYQTQMTDLNRQMDEYVKKAPMYQQLQDLQGKMRGFQQPQQGQMGDTGFNRPMPAVMPQQPDPGLMGEMGLYTPETYGGRMGGYGGRMGGYGRQMPQPPGSESVADNRMGMPDYGRGSMDMPSPENVAPEFGNFGERRMGGGFGRRGMGGGYGRQMPQQSMGLQGLYSMLQGRRGGPFGGY